VPNETPKQADDDKTSLAQRAVGLVAIVLGLAAPPVTAYLRATGGPNLAAESVIAYSFLIILVGLVVFYPQILQSENKEVSSMRVAILAIVTTFCVLAMKEGWRTGEVPELDWYWAIVLSAALGAKSFQSFVEKRWK
jgi:hypothetical protein